MPTKTEKMAIRITWTGKGLIASKELIARAISRRSAGRTSRSCKAGS
jgi:hypothetical protein